MVDNTTLTWILLVFIAVFLFSITFAVVLDYFTYQEWRRVKQLAEELDEELEYFHNRNEMDRITGGASERIRAKVEEKLEGEHSPETKRPPQLYLIHGGKKARNTFKPPFDQERD